MFLGLAVGVSEGIAARSLGKLTYGTMGGAIEWKNVHVLPSSSSAFPTESGTNRYYAARGTDAAPVMAGGQTEKFLFFTRAEIMVILITFILLPKSLKTTIYIVRGD